MLQRRAFLECLLDLSNFLNLGTTYSVALISHRLYGVENRKEEYKELKAVMAVHTCRRLADFTNALFEKLTHVDAQKVGLGVSTTLLDNMAARLWS